jgi:hypothetical protein
MANTLTNLIPDTYAALDVVSRELAGFIPAISRDASADRCALNATLRSHVAPANSGGTDITPAMSLPSASDQTISNKAIQITKARAFPFSWTGEEQYAMNTGPGYLSIRQNQIAQAMRAAVNEIETDLASEMRKAASRAHGTAGTTPFASDLSASAQLNKILLDNGGTAGDKQLVLNTAAGAALRSLLNNPLNANASLGNDVSRQGVLIDVNGFVHRESAQLGLVTKGTGTSYQTNGSLAIGATSVTVDTGSGTIVAGDVITFAGDSTKYVVTSALASNVFTIAAPGLLAAVADNVAITVGNNFTPSVGFLRHAGILATRLPAVPEEGDQARMRETIIDPRTGLAFELAVYPGFRMNVYHLSIAWGVKALKPEHIALLLG